MSERVKSFADLADPPVFATKPKPAQPVDKESISRIAREHNFPSRQAPRTPKESRQKARTHRTGRSVQFNGKVTAETKERFYKVADERNVVLGELIRQGLDALEAVDALEKLARQRGVSLNEIVASAINALERAGGSSAS